MRAHIIENGIVVNTIEVESLDFLPNLVEATEGAIGWSYDGEKFTLPPEPEPTPDPAPNEVPRYCGLLALKRHRIAGGELQELGEEESWEAGSLYADVLSYRAAMSAGAARDKLDVGLNDVQHWLLMSPMVADLCAVLGLSAVQRDALFKWAKAHEATL